MDRIQSEHCKMQALFILTFGQSNWSKMEAKNRGNGIWKMISRTILTSKKRKMNWKRASKMNEENLTRDKDVCMWFWPLQNMELFLKWCHTYIALSCTSLIDKNLDSSLCGVCSVCTMCCIGVCVCICCVCEIGFITAKNAIKYQGKKDFYKSLTF